MKNPIPAAYRDIHRECCFNRASPAAIFREPSEEQDHPAGQGHWRAAKDTAFNGTSWWEHIKVLAADNMEGRDTGSPGLKKAEAYVVGQLKSAGLQPAGVKGYYQPVKFVSRQLVEQESSAALLRDGKAEPLTLGEDAIFSTRVDLAPEVEAPLVFVGYGLSIPENDFDDLAGLDLRARSRS